MGYRILDVKVAKIDPERNKLVIKRRKIRAGKARFLNNNFVVDDATLITDKDNHAIKLAQIKINNRITIDFVKSPEKKFLAKGISIL